MLTTKADMGDKLKAFQDAIERLEKRFGKGTIMRLGQARCHNGVEVIPSGSLSLDLALGAGGIPRGRITEIFGPESSGKSTLTQHIMAEAQKMGGLAVYIDVEHAFDPVYAAGCGVVVDDLFIAQPDWGEQALEIAGEVVRSGAVDLVVIDSVAALAPKDEVEGEMGEVHMGLQARLMSQAMRKLCAANSHGQAAIVFTNQLREKVGIVFGSREFTSGGRALRFYASVRIDLRVLESIKDGERQVGSSIIARVVKNKVAPPFRSGKFDIIFGQGISREGEVVDLGVELGVIKKNGFWYQWNGRSLGQGREATRRFLKEQPEIGAEIEKLIRAAAGCDGSVLK
jgi:recombination protein RecA